RLFALLIGRELDDEEGAVRSGEAVQEAVADDRDQGLRAGQGADDLLEPLDRGGGAADRRARRELYLDEESALILLRKKARGGRPEEQSGARRDKDQKGDPEDGPPDQQSDDSAVLVARPVDEPQDVGHRPLALMDGLEDQRAKRGAEGQRVHRRDQHGDGNRHRELLVEHARDARYEADRHEAG